MTVAYNPAAAIAPDTSKQLISPYAPDLPDFGASGSNSVLNVVPRTPFSYGPVGTLTAATSGALDNRCQGAAAFIDNSGATYIFAGDIHDLYVYTSSSGLWTKVSKTNGGYATSADGQWNFEYFGGDVIATNFADAIQAYTLGTSTKFADLANGGITALTLVAGSGYTNGTYALSVTGPGAGTGFAGTVTVSGGALTSYAITNVGTLYPSTATIAIPAGAGAGAGGSITPTIANIAPKARYLSVVKNFLVLCNTWDSVDAFQTQRVWWSGLGNARLWPTPGGQAAAAVQSSRNDLFGKGGWIQGIVGNLGNSDAAILMEHAVWRMVYAGPPEVFDFFPAQGAKGCPAPNSIVQLQGNAYYLGEDGFYVFDGMNSQPIGANKVDKTFYANLNGAFMSRVIGAADPLNKLVWWGYPSISTLSGNPDKLLAYNWDPEINRWSLVEATVETIIRLLTTGYTLDQLYTILGYTIDALPAPLGSRFWQGGVLTFGAFNSAHKLAYFSGQNMAASVETSESELFDGQRSFVTNSRPLVDGGTPSISIGVRERLVDMVTYKPASSMNRLGTCPQRCSGRYVRAVIDTSLGDTWTNIQGTEIDAIPVGIR